MQKSSLAVILFVGIFLLYTGVRGSEGFTHPIPGFNFQTYGFTDNFETSTLDSTHWAGSLQTNLQGTGAIIQGNSQTVISGGLQNSGGYYVTKDSYVGTSATISVKVTADNQAAPTLMISSSPFTMSAPLDCKIPWYLMVFVSETQVGAPSRNNYFLYVEHCGGGGTTDVQVLYPDVTTYTSPPTGTLQIQVASGSVKFSVDGVVKYTESWSLPSTNIYAGFGNFSPTDLSGSATFKTFILNTGTAPPPTYSDVTITYNGQGTSNPAAGHYTSTYPQGDSITFATTPANGWSFDHLTATTGTVNNLRVDTIGATENIVVYFTQGTSTKGTLRVWASYNGAYVSASVTVTPGPLTGTTLTDGNALSWQVDSGMSYHVSGSYSQGTATPVDVTVYQGQNADVYLNFGGSSPPINFDFLAILDNATVRTFMVIIGVFMSGLSMIMLVTGKKTLSLPSPTA